MVLTFTPIILFTYGYHMTSQMQHWQFVIFLHLQCLILSVSFMRSISCLLSRPSRINYIFWVCRSFTWPLTPFIMNLVLSCTQFACQPLLANKEIPLYDLHCVNTSLDTLDFLHAYQTDKFQQAVQCLAFYHHDSICIIGTLFSGDLVQFVC